MISSESNRNVEIVQLLKSLRCSSLPLVLEDLEDRPWKVLPDVSTLRGQQMTCKEWRADSEAITSKLTLRRWKAICAATYAMPTPLPHYFWHQCRRGGQRSWGGAGKVQLALFFSLGRSSICPYDIDYTHCANLVQGIALSKTALGSPVIMLHAYASKGCPLHAQLSRWRFLLMAAVRTLLLQILGSRVLTCRPHEGSGTSYSNSSHMP